MSGCMRYKCKNIQTHLAQQYALGHLSHRVKTRVEMLIKHDKEFEKVMYEWQKHLSALMQSVTDEKPPEHVWKALERQIGQVTAPSHWFAIIWRTVGAVSFVMLCAVSLLLWQQLQMPQVSHQSSPSYLAVMSAPEQPKVIVFVLSAYQGKKAGQSVLKLQWEKANPVQDQTTFNQDELTLWAIERDTGKRVEVGRLSSLTSDNALTKDAWLKIKNSAELEVSLGKKIVYRGPCLQLSEWEKAS